MKFYVYQVEAINDYQNTAADIDYDYTNDFNEVANLRGYVKNDYYISDCDDLKIGHIYCNGDIIKIIKLVTTFDGDPITLKFFK